MCAHDFCKNPNRMDSKKKHHPPTQNNPMVVLCREYKSISEYQMKGNNNYVHENIGISHSIHSVISQAQLISEAKS